jgi:hypothetical protein
MPDGERVTTGSEPRWWKRRLAKALEALSTGGLSLMVQEVEPGHDEQTETCRVCGGRGWHTAGGNDPAACGACAAGEAWYGWAEWQPDPRTVGAVVKALREEYANTTVCGDFKKAIDLIEERFNPSAPGGDEQTDWKRLCRNLVDPAPGTWQKALREAREALDKE